MTAPESVLTHEQQAVIDSSARIVVVGACPGSGKTRVFVEALRRRLVKYADRRAGGVAALSFTNVAQAEIAARLGSAPGHPHFVGTLDAFMLRFVVRPFGHLLGLSSEGLHLIPSPFNEQIDNPKAYFGPEARDKVSVFRAHACGGTVEAPVFSFWHPIKRKEEMVRDAYASAMLRVKMEQWRSRGRITHSDCQYLAAAILSHRQHGTAVLDLLSRRFPEILVDEFQDTGWFLSQALLKMLGHPTVRGLVVGDPDQAIYEFSGANPNLFREVRDISGAAFVPLSITQRCPHRVAAIATELSATNATVSARKDALDGRAILLVHDLDVPRLDERIIANIERIRGTGGKLAILARRGAVVAKLAGIGIDGADKVAPVGRRITRAIARLHAGEAAEAARSISGVLGDILLGDSSPTPADLRECGIERRAWRLAQYQMLMEVSRAVDGESWNGWLARCKGAVQAAATDLGRTLNKRSLGSKFKGNRTDGLSLRITPTPETPKASNELATMPHPTTIHQVKGAEFDTVVLFVPKPHGRHNPCPSTEWWPASTDLEERRIAYVAVSRARKVLLMCIHRETLGKLRTKRRSFLRLFDEMIDLDTGNAPP